MEKKKPLFTEKERAVLRNVIDNNRQLKGNSWKEYTQEEIMEIYGFLPSWAVKLPPKNTK